MPKKIVVGINPTESSKPNQRGNNTKESYDLIEDVNYKTKHAFKVRPI